VDSGSLCLKGPRGGGTLQQAAQAARAACATHRGRKRGASVASEWRGRSPFTQPSPLPAARACAVRCAPPCSCAAPRRLRWRLRRARRRGMRRRRLRPRGGGSWRRRCRRARPCAQPPHRLPCRRRPPPSRRPFLRRAARLSPRSASRPPSWSAWSGRGLRGHPRCRWDRGMKGGGCEASHRPCRQPPPPFPA